MRHGLWGCTPGVESRFGHLALCFQVMTNLWDSDGLGLMGARGAFERARSSPLTGPEHASQSIHAIPDCLMHLMGFDWLAL